MKLSVVIVNYNVKYFLEQCLLTVQCAMTGIDGEILVVDNNSVDGSEEMLEKRFPTVTKIYNKENVGFAKANNKAIRMAKGEYVLLLNPDTLVENDTFSKVISFMDNHPDAGALGVKMVDGKGKFLPESKRSLPTPTVAFYYIFGLDKLFPNSKRFGKYHLSYLNPDEIHKVDILAGSFMFIRKSALDEVGLLDETFFMYGEDIDLSYRIIKAGYNNYYFPETRIIHYKGESTKKGSLNYVRIFYGAMKIFSDKHFSKRNAKYYNLLINSAIYLRAFFAVLSRFLHVVLLPVLDTVFLYLGFRIIEHYWINIKFGGVNIYPDYYHFIIIPLYIIFWLTSCFLSGCYDKLLKINKIIQGISIGTIAILVIYALLPETYRHSRFLILTGAVYAIVIMILNRLVLAKMKFAGYATNATSVKKIAVVGYRDEVQRVDNILNQTGLHQHNRVYVSVDDTTPGGDGFVGGISQIKEIINIHKINQIIFCARDISSKDIITLMSKLQQADMEFKIAPPESMAIIGSNSINTTGELYFIDINTINKPENRRNKRTIDIVASLLFLLFSPMLIFFQKKPKHFFGDVLRVLIGKISWVGYFTEKKEYYDTLPKIKKGILSPMIVVNETMKNTINPYEINLLYAKNYIANNDIKIILKGIRFL